ncbi:hypothetical protein CPB84DRAFT_1746125 [Gymnopilus junonius]|uniref:Uncharacterized protein n=1 Tax=Gymnopilus junonius TaxID=109634 RepID=A0A9P5NP06_GYMJU|nr:hypothetical protein CPB84DRAFT_1746125 [Gymnopilus junonius]
MNNLLRCAWARSSVTFFRPIFLQKQKPAYNLSADSWATWKVVLATYSGMRSGAVIRPLYTPDPKRMLVTGQEASDISELTKPIYSLCAEKGISRLIRYGDECRRRAPYFSASFKDSRNKVKKQYYLCKGQALIRFILSPFPEHANDPALLLEIIELMSPVDSVVHDYDHTSLSPSPAAVIRNGCEGKTQTLGL